MSSPTELYPVERAGDSGPRTGRLRRQNRVIAFGLSGDDWDALIEMAALEARDPFQQARWVVLQAIREYTERRAS